VWSVRALKFSGIKSESGVDGYILQQTRAVYMIMTVVTD
jgi:hypothetical protein